MIECKFRCVEAAQIARSPEVVMAKVVMTPLIEVEGELDEASGRLELHVESDAVSEPFVVGADYVVAMKRLPKK